MKAAYKQIPMDAMHASLTVIIVYDIRANRWRFVISHALLFGLSGAVLQFNRVPTFIVALARRWLAIMTHAFFDDFRIIDFDCERQSAVRWFDKLVELLGWTFDKEKAQTGLNVLPMLGNLERYSDIGFSESLIVEAKPERLRDMEDLIDTVLANKECLSGTAASIRGRSLHLSLTRPGKTGRLPIPSIDAIAENRNFGWSEGLEADLLFLRQQLASKHIRKYRLTNSIVLAPRLWSDASFSVINGRPFMRICCICATTSAAKGIVYDTDEAFFRKLCTRKSQIAVGELMGVMIALLIFGDVLRGSSAIAFIDNMSALHSIVNGSSSTADIKLLAHCFSLIACDLELTIWLEYVNTLSNCSDGGSRVGVLCQLAASLNVPLRTIACPILHDEFPRPSLQREAIKLA
jgi:hypothetical protein